MKRIVFFFSIFLLVGCTINQQTKEIKALANCQYRIFSIDELYVAGTKVEKLIERKKFDPASIPSLAFGFLNQDIPLKANVTVEIINTTDMTASIQEFDYELFINQHELTKGTYDQPITISAGDTTRVPVTLTANVYSFLANDSIRNQIQQFLQATQQGIEKKATLTIKIKPGILIGKQIIKLPRAISINRDLSNQHLR